MKDCVSDFGRPGYSLEIAIKCLFLQFYYDLSDRQMEQKIRDSIAVKWFLDFEITGKLFSPLWL
ncbi:transposase [Candidatus Margulisiibacteriota bacterium]